MCAKKNKTFDLTKKIKNKNYFTYFNLNDKGKGHALWNGIKKTKRKYICNIDADEQFYPKDIIKMYNTIKKNKNLTAVHASRFMEGLIEKIIMMEILEFLAIISCLSLYLY